MEPTGVILLSKPAVLTSHDCVNRMRRLFNTKKVGHTGTLDPMATGVLPILIGRATKAADLLVSDSKKYRAGLKLGVTTDTEDTTGTVITKTEVLPTSEQVHTACTSFIGDIMQTPPMYSALKVDGKKLVDLAREGITVERKARPITVYSIAVANGESPADYILDVHCSKGTYIRTLCADIGASLGCGGAMSSLVRTASGSFDIADCVTLDELEKMTVEERYSLLLPIESLFSDLPEIRPAPFFEKLSRDGNEIYQRKLGTSLPVGTRVRLSGKDGFYALGEVRDFPDGSAVKVIKLFSI